MMRTFTRAIVLPAAALLLVAGCGPSDDDTDTAQRGQDETAGETMTTDTAALATATLTDADGGEVGTVSFAEAEEGGLAITAEVHGLEPGFYGFHIHTVGKCEPDSTDPDDPSKTGDFLSAGGHLGANASDHGEHAGDLPSLQVTSAGTATLTTVTDALTADELLDDDGSAVMVHAGRDNFANIPERYAPDGPDEQTLKTGDAGDRLACGVVE